MGNTLKTFGLLGLLGALLVLAGNVLGGPRGALVALVLAAVMNFGAYWFSDRLVLARYRARELAPGENPRLERIVVNLAARAGIPRPRIYLLPAGQPNAFATGRDPAHAAVAATEGLLELLTDEELEGVIGHELGHVVHRDILVGTIAATLAAAVMFLASMARWGLILGGFGGRDRDEGAGGVLGYLLLVLLAPLAATLVQLAVSRSREFAADQESARLTGNPVGLARALAKIGGLARRVPMDASPATAHMFIVSPLAGGDAIAKLFSTHPPIKERIRRLVGDRPLF